MPSLFHWMAAGFLAFGVAVGGAIVAREPIAQAGAQLILRNAGIAVRSLDVTDIVLDHLTIEQVALGGASGPSAKRVDIAWTAGTLAESRVAQISIAEPTVTLSYADGRIDVDGFALGESGAGGVAPFDRLSIGAAHVALETPWGAVDLRGDAEIVSGEKGLSLASARLLAASMDVAGGSLLIGDTVVAPGTPVDATLQIENVDLQSLLTLAGVAGASGPGSISGKIPFHLYLSDNAIGIDRLEIETANLAIATPWGLAELIGDLGLVSGPNGIVPAIGHLTSATMDIAGGRLSLADVVFAPDRPIEANLRVQELDLQAVLTMIDVEGLTGSGSITGAIPIRLDKNGVSVSDGKMAAMGPGVLRYSGAALPKDVPGDDRRAADSIALARDALADFHYTGLTLGLDRAASGEGILTVKMEGANPHVLDNHPFVLNIRLDANFDKLAQILLDGYARAEQILQGSRRR